jgi:hypothetical protein
MQGLVIAQRIVQGAHVHEKNLRKVVEVIGEQLSNLQQLPRMDVMRQFASAALDGSHKGTPIAENFVQEQSVVYDLLCKRYHSRATSMH